MMEMSLPRKLTKDRVLLMGAEKQLNDKKVYQKVSNSENILSKLAETSRCLVA